MLVPTLRRVGAGLALVLLATQAPHAATPPSRGTAPGSGREFVFTRIRYDPPLEWGGFRMGSRWSHDYPRADLHLSRLLSELTTIDASGESSLVLTLDNPELFRHPIIYISEPGFWGMSEAEAGNLGRYIQKGGFLIFDDFEHEQWLNFEAQMRRALPSLRLVELDVSHPLFQSFYAMETIDFPHPLVDVMPTYYGIYDANDPNEQLIGIVNYNNDVAEYWEWSDTGWLPIDITNEAYKLGINYIIYAMTHWGEWLAWFDHRAPPTE